MKKSVAEILLKSECVQFNFAHPFTYASGLKGPIYCDNRLLLSQPLARQEILRYFLQAIKNFSPSLQAVVGVATAGIPFAAWIAKALDCPMGYLRAEAKGHGKQNQLEGGLAGGQNIIVLEDLVNQGTSSLAATRTLLEGGHKVLGLYCVVNYEMPVAQNGFLQLKTPLIALTDFSTLVECALELGFLQVEHREGILSWQRNPIGWNSNSIKNEINK